MFKSQVFRTMTVQLTQSETSYKIVATVPSETLRGITPTLNLETNSQDIIIAALNAYADSFNLPPKE